MPLSLDRTGDIYGKYLTRFDGCSYGKFIIFVSLSRVDTSTLTVPGIPKTVTFLLFLSCRMNILKQIKIDQK